MTPEITTLLKLETVAETDGAKKFDDRLKQNQRTINSVTKDLKIQEMMLRRKNRSYNYVKAAVAGATKEELKAILAHEKNIARMREQDAQMAKNNKTLRMMRGGFGQVGHQVQDVAVQLQGGTDAMIVFGQQGSQIVSLFGPKGAMIGAILAVGAALATSLKSGLDEATKDLDDFVEATREQASELGMLTQAQKDFDEAAKKAQVEELTEQQSDFEDQVSATKDKIATLERFIKQQEAVLSQYGKEVVDNDGNLRALREQLDHYNNALIDQRNNLHNTTGALDELTNGTFTAAEAERERIDTINELVRAAAEEAHTIGMTSREQAIYKAMTEGANEAQIAALNHIHDLIDARKAEEESIKETNKAEKKRRDTINGLIKAAATQATTTGMTKRELDIYRATLQGASDQEIASLNALHDIIDARQELTKELKAQKDAQQALQEAEEDAFTTGFKKILSRIEDKELAARMSADEQLAIAKEAANRGMLTETEYAQAVLAIHQDLHNKLGELRGTSGQGPERTIVDVGTDFDALLESQKTELDLFREHQQKKLDLITEHEDAVNDVMIDYAQMRKDIADETAAYELASQMMTQQQVLGIMQQQLSQLGGMFDKASALGKAFFVAQQALAAVQAIIQGELASMNILAANSAIPGGVPYAITMAAMAKAMGYASAAAIMGQTVASFEGGGITFNGVRSGGMDGRGGRLAMVHPNEKITDMEKAPPSEQPVNVNINIQAVDAKGIDELLVKRRGVITSLVRNSLNNTGARLG